MCLLQQPFSVFRLLLLLLFVFAHTKAAPQIFRSTFQLQERENANRPLQGSNSTLNTTFQGFEHGWVPGPGHRGTLSLVFSCTFTLFLCVWTTVNVNLEPEGNYNYSNMIIQIIPVLGRKSGASTKSSRAVARLLASKTARKLGWSFVTLIVPEGAMSIAAYERWTAHRLRTKVKDHGYANFDTRLGYYAVMGGFVIPNEDMITQHGKAEASASEANQELENGKEAGEISPAAALNDKKIATVATSSSREKEGRHSANPETTTRIDGSSTSLSNPHNKRLTLTPHGVLQVAIWGKLPQITSAEVQDKSNASSLAKLLVFWQALWMIVQVIGRTADSLPVTLLELHTVLHAFCAVAMYFTWWAKPVDIECPTPVTGLTIEECRILQEGGAETENPTNPFAKVPGPNSTLSWKTPRDDDYVTSRAGLGKLMYLSLSHQKNVLREYFEVIEFAYQTLWASRKRIWREGLSISVVGLIYGGVHLAAWNYPFPSTEEQILWQVSALATAIATSAFVLSLCLSVFVTTNNSKWVGKICGIVFGIGVFPCLVFRAYLLFEGFFALRKLPAGSYDIAEWANMWPHVG